MAPKAMVNQRLINDAPDMVAPDMICDGGDGGDGGNMVANMAMADGDTDSSPPHLWLLAVMKATKVLIPSQARKAVAYRILRTWFWWLNMVMTA